jgi:hypothetical protein
MKVRAGILGSGSFAATVSIGYGDEPVPASVHRASNAAAAPASGPTDTSSSSSPPTSAGAYAASS